MKKYIKIILNIIICTLFMIFFINIGKVNAQKLKFGIDEFTVDVYGGSGRTSDLLLGANHIFCIQEGKSVGNEVKYNVAYYAKIVGSQCTIYKGNSNASSKKLGTTNNLENARFAWIVSQNDIEIGKNSNGVWDVEWTTKNAIDSYGNSVKVAAHKVNKDGYHGSDQYDHVYSKIQKEVYGYISTWLGAQNQYIKNIASTGNGKGTTEWEEYANEYAKAFAENNTEASITNNTNMDKLKKEAYVYNGENYTKIGPFNFTFTGSYSSSKVYDQNNKEITVKYASYSGTTLKVYNTINEASKTGEDFYILIPTNSGAYKINKFTATVSCTRDNITTEVWILTRNIDTTQNIISTYSENDPLTTTDSIEITDIELIGNLSIEKVDKDNENTKLAGVGVILKNVKSGKYVKQENDIIKYVSKAQATEFVTDNSGKITVNNLLLGDYIIYETKNPNYGYEEVSFDNPLKVAEINISSSSTYSYKIQNEKETGNIRILKRDADTDSPIAGVTFVLKNSAGQYIIVKNSAGENVGTVTGSIYVGGMETTTSKDSATKFITDSNGNITISNILIDTYTLEEVSLGDNHYGYEIDTDNIEWEINGSNKGNGVTVTFEVERQESGSTQSSTTITESNADSVKVMNIKQTGNIRILKRDADSDKAIAGVTFVLKNSEGKYIIVKNEAGESVGTVTGSIYVGGMETTTSKDSATKFITDSNGNITISNILIDTYTLEEVSLGDNHYGYEIDTDNIEWEINGTDKGNGLTVNFEVERQESSSTQNNSTVAESNSDNVKVKNIKQTGNLRILKRDADTDVPLSGVTFILKNSEGKYVIVKNESGQAIESVKGSIYVGGMETTTSKDSATKFITDSNGNITISNILIDTYTLEEVSLGDSNYGYEIAENNIVWEVDGNSEGTGLTVTLEVERQPSTETENNSNVAESNSDNAKVRNIKQTGNIKIYKKDPDSENSLAGMSFVLKASNGQYVVAIDENGKEISQGTGKVYFSNISYTNDINKATKFITDDNGIAIISNIIIDDYTVIEYSVGDKYYGYEVDDDYISWEVNGSDTGAGRNISITLNRQTSDNTTSSSNVTDSNSDSMTVNNKRKYIKLSGFVWEDIHWEEGKNADANELYKDGTLDTEDELLQNVTVKLKDNSGKVLQSAVTDSEGSYLFEDIIIDDLPNLYIEFTYNGMSYECVSLIDLVKENASKASEGTNRKQFNEAYNTITQGKSNKYSLSYKTENYTSTLILGDNVKYGYEGAKYPISGVYEQYEIQSTTKNACGGGLDKIKSPEEIRANAIEEVKNINLGLKEREQPDLAVVKDVYAAKVTFLGEDFTYLYEDRLKAENQDKDSTYNMDPQVKFGQERGSQTYTRALYASDIKYTGENELAVKVIYRIGIHNQTTNLKMKVNEIADYFDSKYELESAIAGTGISSDGATITGQVQVSDRQGYNSEYSKVTINPNITLDPQTETIIYLQLTVKKQNINNIVDIGEEVKLDNIIEISSYGTLDKNGEVYAGIDVDSQPGNAVPGNTSTYEDDTDIAPGILLVLQEERTTEGTVFEDQVTQSSLDAGTRQGSGTYDSGELGIAGIEVKVVNEEDGSTAQVYDSENGTWKDATAITDSEGKYYIGGFIPGKYHIVYTWGGKEYTLSDGNSKTITVQDYKGTIVNQQSHTAKATDEEWYKDEFKQGYSGIEWDSASNTEIRRSDAVDNYEQRTAIDSELTDVTYETKQSGTTISTIESTTPGFKINLEYVDSPIDASEEYELNADGSPKIENGYLVKKDGYKNTMDSIDFGIVERPRQTIALAKNVKNIKLILANGSTLFDANINENGKFVDDEGNEIEPNYIAYIPEEDQNKAQLKIEIDSEIVQGATLEINYGFKVSNEGEIDYATEDYYFYGTGHGEVADQKVTLRATEIIDYIDNEIAVDMEENSQWHLLSDDDINSNYRGKLLADTTYLDTIERKISTDALSGEALEPNETISVEFITSKYLANNEETFIENHAEIIHVQKNGGSSLTTTPGNYVPTESSTSEPDNDYAEDVYITPPTGLTDYTISYVILAISTLGILVAGIILIKRFVIK